jgi:hypothetical protein
MWVEIDTGLASIPEIVERTKIISEKRAKRRKP